MFDLATDPDEINELVESGEFSEVGATRATRPREFVDPANANDRAFADQAAKVTALGDAGKALAASKSFGFTPAGS